MTQKQFTTRKASFPLLRPEHTHGATNLLHETAGDLEFRNRGSARLLVKPTAGGGIAACRQRFSHAAFCSVSAASAASSPPSSDSRRGAGKDTGATQSERCTRGQSQAPPSLERLPVAVKKGDQLLPYVWDGHRITAMNEAALQDSDVTTGRLRNWVLGLQRQLREAFLPDPRDVTPDYWDWLRWRLSQRFFSSTMQNFSFSALLMATGLGAKKAFAASAAINWLLKDGVSRIVRMSVSTSFGQTFDADLKRMRFITSLIFTGCMAGEFVTPFWPQHFVALASISSVGRAVGLSAFVATQPAFQAALATGGNLADLTSKNQAQHMVMDMLALGVSAGLTWLFRGMPRGGLLLPAVMYPICAAGDLTCIWHELKAVQLRNLNRERAEMIIERWMRRGAVPDAAEISAAESLVLPSDVWRGMLPLRIIPLDRLAPADPGALRGLLREYDSEEYVMHVTGQQRAGAGSAAVAATGGGSSSGGGGAGGGGGAWRLPWATGGGGGGGAQPEVLVSLSDRATASDIAKALLHAAYLRKAVLEHFAARGLGAHRHHHHKQLHHHNHHNHHNHHVQAGSLGGSVGDLFNHHHHNSHNHHNHHHNHHNQQQQQQYDEKSGIASSAPDSDVINRHCRSNGRDQSPGTHELQEKRQELAHQHGAGTNGAGTNGAGTNGAGTNGAVLVAHAHDHVHWDEHHHMLYHHNHFHTHQMDPGPHGRSHDGQGGGGGAARTASLSLSTGGAASGGAAASGGGCRAGPHGEAVGGEVSAGTATGEQRDDDHRHHHQQQHHRLTGPPGGGPGSEPAWEQLDEAVWGELLRTSRREAACNLPRLLREAEQAGWKMKPFMLNTTERVQYVRL